MIDLTVSCTGLRQIKDLKKEGQRAGQKRLAIMKTEHRLVEITAGEGGGEQYSFFSPPEICPCQARMKSFYSLTIYIVVGK